MVIHRDSSNAAFSAFVSEHLTPNTSLTLACGAGRGGAGGGGRNAMTVVWFGQEFQLNRSIRDWTHQPATQEGQERNAEASSTLAVKAAKDSKQGGRNPESQITETKELSQERKVSLKHHGGFQAGTGKWGPQEPKRSRGWATSKWEHASLTSPPPLRLQVWFYIFMSLRVCCRQLGQEGRRTLLLTSSFLITLTFSVNAGKRRRGAVMAGIKMASIHGMPAMLFRALSTHWKQQLPGRKLPR